MFRIRRAIADVDLLEAAGNQQVGKRVGMDRPDVRDIADVAFEKREPARRVDGLENHRRPRAQLVESGVEESSEIARLEVFDHLGREQSTQRTVRLRQKIGERIRFGGVESLLAADVDHRGVKVNATGLDSLFAKEREKLAAAAADVEHVASALEERQILGYPLADVIGGAAEPVLETDVYVAVERLDLTCRNRSGSGDGVRSGSDRL